MRFPFARPDRSLPLPCSTMYPLNLPSGPHSTPLALALLHLSFHLKMLRSWRYGAKLQRALDFWTGNALSSAFRHWRDACNRGLRLKATMLQVASRWGNLTLGSALAAWKAWAGEHRAMRQAAVRGVLHWQNRSLAGAFEGWREYVEWRVTMKGAAMAVFTRMCKAREGAT